MSTELILGPPGTGKTSALLDILDEELTRGTPPHKIGFISFTRAAADVAVTRAMERFSLERTDLPWFRTTHSLCYRVLGLHTSEVLAGRLIRDFSTWGGIQVTGRWDPEGGMSGYTVGDRILHMEHLARVRCLPLRTVYDEDDDGLPWSEVERVSRFFGAYKAARRLTDYTDMLLRAPAETAPPALDVLLADEVQDSSEAMWRTLDWLSRGVRRVVYAGDDDQCHPPGTMVQTTEGPIDIEVLGADHRVILYDQGSSEVRVNGRTVQKESHEYKGDMYNINGMNCTPDHKLWVRWGRRDGYVTYLMKRGDFYRVGWCKFFNGHAILHPASRMRMEDADALWILKWFETKKEASLYESEVSTTYQITMLPFLELKGSVIYTQDSLDEVHQRLVGYGKIERCLTDHKCLSLYPFVSRGSLNKRGTVGMLTVAANVIPGVALVAKLKTRKKIAWVPAEVNTTHYEGLVYSLDAPPYRYYFADDVMVHNCIYAWAGANVTRMLTLDAPSRVLGQSHRVPRAVQRVAAEVIARVQRRRPKSWAARTAEGSVHRVADISQADVETGEVLVLARNNFVIQEQIVPEMRRRGIYYSWDGRGPVEEETLVRIRTWEKLRAGGSVPVEDVLPVYAVMTSGRGYAKGMRSLKAFTDRTQPVTLDNLKKTGGLLTDAIWHEALDRLPKGDVAFILAARRRGERTSGAPRVRLSTIHGAKGDESDNVVLMLECAARTAREAERQPEDEARVFYVGCTRARERLTIVDTTAQHRYAL